MPNRPRAGALFIALVAVMNEETFEPVAAGTLSCRAKIGRRNARLKGKEFADGIGSCAWQIAPNTGGKRFSATIELTSDEGYVVQRFAKLVRR